jgi:regulator of sigma E protease
MIGGPDESLVRVIEVAPGSAAEAAGLLPEDLLLEVDGEPVGGTVELSQRIRASVGEPLTLLVQREDGTHEVVLIPRADIPQGEGPAGFSSLPAVVPYPPLRALSSSVEGIGWLVSETLRAIPRLLTGGGEGGEARLVGVFGLKQASDWALESSLRWQAAYPILYLATLINVGLGFTNLLPIPALDGGRIALVLLEIVRRKPIDQTVERGLNAAGLLALLVLMILLSIQDLLRPLF